MNAEIDASEASRLFEAWVDQRGVRYVARVYGFGGPSSIQRQYGRTQSGRQITSHVLTLTLARWEQARLLGVAFDDPVLDGHDTDEAKTSASVTGGISMDTGDLTGAAMALGVGGISSIGSPCPPAHAISATDSVAKAPKSDSFIVNLAFIGFPLRNKIRTATASASKVCGG